MFGAMPGAMPGGNLGAIKCGQMQKVGTTVTADPKKGILAVSEGEGFKNLTWKDRETNKVEKEWMIFPGDATIRHLTECTDGYAMLVQFSQSGNQFFFYSQEPRKKGSSWDDVSKEKELLEKINASLNGTSAPTGGALGMSQEELMRMLGVAAPPATGAAAPAAEEPSASAAATPAAAAPADAAPPAATAAQFDPAAISNILSGLPAAPAAPAAGAPAAPAAQFDPAAIANILGGIGGQPAQPPVALNEVLRPEDAVPKVDTEMEAALAEHLPQGGAVPDSAAETLSTPQMAQAAMRFTEALYQGEAAGLIRELNLNPTGLGVEPFLRALQASTDAEQAAAASSDSTAMDTEEKPAKEEDKMDES